MLPRSLAALSHSLATPFHWLEMLLRCFEESSGVSTIPVSMTSVLESDCDKDDSGLRFWSNSGKILADQPIFDKEFVASQISL